MCSATGVLLSHEQKVQGTLLRKSWVLIEDSDITRAPALNLIVFVGDDCGMRHFPQRCRGAARRARQTTQRPCVQQRYIMHMHVLPRHDQQPHWSRSRRIQATTRTPVKWRGALSCMARRKATMWCSLTQQARRGCLIQKALHVSHDQCLGVGTKAKRMLRLA